MLVYMSCSCCTWNEEEQQQQGGCWVVLELSVVEDVAIVHMQVYVVVGIHGQGRGIMTRLSTSLQQTRARG